MEKQSFPILEFDPERKAILEPQAVEIGNGALQNTVPPTPERAVLCFFQEVLRNLEQNGGLQVVGYLKSEIGPNPIYELSYQNQRLLVLHPGVGAPLSAGFLEEMIASGVQKFICCGGCGVLDRKIVAGHPIILTSAVRDEGTSYHYLPPGREVSSDPQAIAALEVVFQQRHLPYLLSKTWTTDAIYRETVDKRAARMAEGCMVVEMEAAAFFAVAQFRGVQFGQVVYSGDLVIPEGWDGRAWLDRHSERELLFWIAVEACLRL